MSLERYSFCFLRYVHVYQAVSFDLKQGETIRNKAFRWESLTRFLAESPEHPKILLLLGAPSGEQRKDYAKAKELLRSSRLVELVEEDEAADFARDLEARVAAVSAA